MYYLLQGTYQKRAHRDSIDICLYSLVITSHQLCLEGGILQEGQGTHKKGRATCKKEQGTLTRAQGTCREERGTPNYAGGDFFQTGICHTPQIKPVKRWNYSPALVPTASSSWRWQVRNKGIEGTLCKLATCQHRWTKFAQFNSKKILATENVSIVPKSFIISGRKDLGDERFLSLELEPFSSFAEKKWA